jgi:hypothetical protein
MVFPKFNWENSRFSILVEASKELYKNHGCLISNAYVIYYLQLANLICHNRQIKFSSSQSTILNKWNVVDRTNAYFGNSKMIYKKEQGESPTPISARWGVIHNRTK